MSNSQTHRQSQPAPRALYLQSAQALPRGHYQPDTEKKEEARPLALCTYSRHRPCQGAIINRTLQEREAFCGPPVAPPPPPPRERERERERERVPRFRFIDKPTVPFNDLQDPETERSSKESPLDLPSRRPFLLYFFQALMRFKQAQQGPL